MQQIAELNDHASIESFLRFEEPTDGTRCVAVDHNV